MSLSKGAKTSLIVLGILLFPSALYVIFTTGKHHVEIPPALGPVTNGTAYTVPTFSFTNQNGETINSGTTRGNLLVFNFFCVDCGGESDRNATIIKDVAEHFFDKKDIRYISINSVPSNNSLKSFKAYALPFGDIYNYWDFVTADSAYLVNFVHNGLLIGSKWDPIGQSFGPGLSTIIVVDKKGHVRAFLDGTKYTNEKKLIDTIKFIRLEEYRENSKRREEQFERKR